MEAIRHAVDEYQDDLVATHRPLHDLFANEEKTANLRTAISER